MMTVAESCSWGPLYDDPIYLQKYLDRAYLWGTVWEEAFRLLIPHVLLRPLIRVHCFHEADNEEDYYGGDGLAPQ